MRKMPARSTLAGHSLFAFRPTRICLRSQRAYAVARVLGRGTGRHEPAPGAAGRYCGMAPRRPDGHSRRSGNHTGRSLSDFAHRSRRRWPRAPVVERLTGTVRRECLDRVLLSRLNEGKN